MDIKKEQRVSVLLLNEVSSGGTAVATAPRSCSQQCEGRLRSGGRHTGDSPAAPKARTSRPEGDFMVVGIVVVGIPRQDYDKLSLCIHGI